MLRYRALGRIVGVIGLLFYAYVAAGLIGGVIPANPGWTPPATGVRIYIEDNGIHTGIVLPARGWDDLVRPGDFRDFRYAAHRWRGFGWGDRAFYIDTPTWWDVRPATIWRAAWGSTRTAMHVDAIPEPRLGRDVRALTLRPAEYARLVAFVRASFAPGAATHGYAGYDVFYPARGRYSAIRTCNAWVGEALRHAGVRTGRWTPLSASVMLSLR